MLVRLDDYSFYHSQETVFPLALPQTEWLTWRKTLLPSQSSFLHSPLGMMTVEVGLVSYTRFLGCMYSGKKWKRSFLDWF